MYNKGKKGIVETGCNDCEKSSEGNGIRTLKSQSKTNSITHKKGTLNWAKEKESRRVDNWMEGIFISRGC